MINTYIKKPVEVTAVQWNGSNLEEINTFMNYQVRHNDTSIFIDTLEGVMQATLNDYIIRGVDGEFYPCKPNIFNKTYILK